MRDHGLKGLGRRWLIEDERCGETLCPVTSAAAETCLGQANDANDAPWSSGTIREDKNMNDYQSPPWGTLLRPNIALAHSSRRQRAKWRLRYGEGVMLMEAEMAVTSDEERGRRTKAEEEQQEEEEEEEPPLALDAVGGRRELAISFCCDRPPRQDLDIEVLPSDQESDQPTPNTDLNESETPLRGPQFEEAREGASLGVRDRERSFSPQRTSLEPVPLEWDRGPLRDTPPHPLPPPHLPYASPATAASQFGISV
ncbi:unnamed protein product [Boreogadus saida]